MGEEALEIKERKKYTLNSKLNTSYCFISPVLAECPSNSLWALGGCLSIMSFHPVSHPLKQVLSHPTCKSQRGSVAYPRLDNYIVVA